jgi:hypothetical protein
VLLVGSLTVGVMSAGAVVSAGPARADVLDDIDAQYDTGAGGGEISLLIHKVLKLRAQGFGPSKGNLADIQAGLDARPNQVPLITALQNTVKFQQRNQARSQPKQQSPVQIGGGGFPPGIVPGSGGSNIPIAGG